jgi:D-3-phosphoglycerate dehydrogenase
MSHKILVSDSIAEEGINVLRSEADVDIKLKLKPAELASIMPEYDALVVRSETKVTSEIIAAGKKLQVIGRAGIGVDNIDLEAATRHGVVVVNAPAGNAVATEGFMGTEVRNKILGIIGLGRVGSEVARMAKGLEMKLIVYDPFVSAEKGRHVGVELVSMEELLRRSDFITVHVPLTETTKALIGTKELALVKPTVRIINAARGGIIDEQALYKALEEGKVAGAAIDVFSKEPATDNVLLKSDRVIVTPHLGASTAEAQTSVAVDVAEQVLTVLKGQSARYAVNAPLISPETAAVLTPFLEVASNVGKLCAQLLEGRLSTIVIRYEGDIANYDASALKATIIGRLIESITDERVNMVNANYIAQSRGLEIVELKVAKCENYANLIAVDVSTDKGTTKVAGTLMRGQTHIVRVNQYWIDIVPTGGYWLFSDHRDRPGIIGAVGMITGKTDINISSMQLGRLEPRGQALMILSLDRQVDEEVRQQLLAIPGIQTAKVVKL